MLRCNLCEKEFHHLGSHIWHKHKIKAREYKEMFGLKYNHALVTQEITEKKRERFNEDREKYLENFKDSKKYQFKKGHKKNINRYRSDEEIQSNTEIIEEVNKRKQIDEPCPVCRMRFNHVESHLFNAHGLKRA